MSFPLVVESLTFVALSPFALLLLGIVTVMAWRRRGVPGALSLCAFTAISGAWVTTDALSLLSPTPSASVVFAAALNMWGGLMCTAWLAFVLSYTERLTPRTRAALFVLASWSVVYGVMGLMNSAHHLVWDQWEVVPRGSLLLVTYTLGPVGWVQTVFSWTAVTLSLGVIVWAYAGSARRQRDLSWWIAAGAVSPMALNVLFIVGLGPLEKDFTPISMALSAAAFALGLTRYQFLDLRPIARAALVENLREGVLVIDLDGRVADANPAIRRALGDDAVAPGASLRETLPRLADSIEHAPSDTFRLGDGPEARYYDVRVSPLANRSGEPSGLLVLLHDVTARRHERAELHRLNAELYDRNAELQARNDELDAFAHTVAHDLKNSAHGVVGWAEVLRDDGPTMGPDAHREVAEGVVRAGHKMGAVIHELLLLAGVRQAAVEPRPVAMAEVVAEAVARVRQSGIAPTRVSASVAPAGWPTGLGHAPWIEEIWVNYLTNAAKYGGASVTLGAEATATHARFWVHDDGPGLSPEEQRQLFVPFARVGSRSSDGHGLGLSIVRRIAERLGGTCGVESAPGAGTRFWFALPLAEPVAEPVEVALRA